MTVDSLVEDTQIFIGPEHRALPDDVAAVAEGGLRVALAPNAIRAIEASRDVLEQAIRNRELVYGVTTGFGPLASEWIAPERASELQVNLVRHLASGVGRPLSPEQSRALLFSRIVVLSKGKSAARLETVERMIDVLNAGLAPVVPSLGTVGASGDLTPLAHAALALCGEGEMWRDGVRIDAGQALEEAGLQPLELSQKEGLALVNGTSAMSALAALNDVRSRRAINVGMSIGALAVEVLNGFAEAFDPLLAEVRGQDGQREAVHELRLRLAGSKRLRSRQGEVPTAAEAARHHEAPQDPYTLRCQQQLFGALLDAGRFHRDIVSREVNAVTDNPIFDGDSGRIVHGGNFFGQHVAFASDTLMTVVIQLAVWAERLVARLTDRSMNHGLPAFLTPETPGIHSGFMGAQVTASALIAELRSKAVPASIQSVPTNANNQDIVTMGTIGALRVSEMLDRTFEVLAIAAMTAVQAMELSEGDDYSPSAHAFAASIRRIVPPLRTDRALSAEITHLARTLSLQGSRNPRAETSHA